MCCCHVHQAPCRTGSSLQQTDEVLLTIAWLRLNLYLHVVFHRRVHDYATIGDADLNFFRGVVGPDSVKTSPEDLEAFNVDWMKKYRGKSPVAVLPTTTEQVSLVLRHCHERHLPVVPQGGNTGLVGGSVPVGGELVLSTSRMNSVISFDPLASVLVCEVCSAQ